MGADWVAALACLVAFGWFRPARVIGEDAFQGPLLEDGISVFALIGILGHQQPQRGGQQPFAQESAPSTAWHLRLKPHATVKRQ
jgi:hypothetical protein